MIRRNRGTATRARDSDDPLVPRPDKPYSEDWDSWSITGDWDFIDLSAAAGDTPLKLTVHGFGDGAGEDWMEGRGDNILTADGKDDGVWKEAA